MALSPRLEVRQSQSLTLTPQLMQSIRLLALGHLELNGFVEAELLRNPLLEREEGTENDPVEPPERPSEGAAYEDTVAHSERIQSASGIADGLDTAVENVFPEQPAEDGPARMPGQWADGRGAGDSGEAPDLDQFIAARPTLADHLGTQITHILAAPADRLIARYLIDGLNDAGYLVVELAAVAEQLGAPLPQVEAVLAAIQGCDPVGVFARNVPECLAIQLREKDRLDPMMSALLAHLDLLAAHQLAALCRVVGCDRDDLDTMLADLRGLDPHPGRAFDGQPVEAVVPDVFVRPGPGGAWAIELNTDILPRVLVNRTYYASVTRKACGAGDKAFLVDCLQTANWLTKSLDQRAQTILKVASEIVRQQDGFLVHGVTRLRPMTLKLVADALQLHESTVSRVTSNKYISTPRGLFEMKYFFTTALGSSSGGEDLSAEAVRHHIRQIVDAEAPEAILSDDTIAAMLQKIQGVEVARRTVAKYREALHIPSSVIRRRQKRQLALAR